ERGRADDREVAVRADALAEGDVDVHPERPVVRVHGGDRSRDVRPTLTSPVVSPPPPNALGLLLRESHLAEVAEFQIWAKVGSADERPGEEGLAHFHEHMLFKGTESRGVGEVAGEIEGVGGRINAYTSYDTTVYHATVPSAGRTVAQDVLVDMVRRSLFEPVEIAREIEVVIDEIRRSDDSPHHLVAEALFATAYRTHPYRAPILGSRESVASFDRDSVLAF